MKLIFILLLITGSFFNAQEVIREKDGTVIIMTHCARKYARDTLAYLKEFEVAKDRYIGKPFSILLSDMTLVQPKTVSSEFHGRKKNITPGSRFKFSPGTPGVGNPATLLIRWQDPVPRDQTKYYEQKNSFYFTTEEKNFYGNKIVKDIFVFR